MSVKNETKIKEFLEKREGEVTISELAEVTGIDLSNISRYWKNLERQGIIKSRQEQQGKRRIVYVKFNVGSVPAADYQDQEIVEPAEPIQEPTETIKEEPMPESKRKQREITDERVIQILQDEKDHTNKYLRNLLLAYNRMFLKGINSKIKIIIEK